MTAPVSRTGATDREVESCGHVHMLGKLPVTCRAEAAPAWLCKLGHLTPAHAAAAPDSNPLREFAEFVVSLGDDDPESPGRQARRTVTLTQLITRARAALLAEQPGGGK